MCGHFGILGPGVIGDDIIVLNELARASVVRGLHGSGVLQGKIERNGKLRYFIEKSSSEMGDLIYRERSLKGGNTYLLNDMFDNFFLGHVRHATKGAINEANAHPFDKSKVAGMHNGTLRWTDYDPKDKTDSEMMFEDFDKHGIEFTLKSLHDESAYAIVALDKVTGEIVFARNKHRPLAYVWNKNRAVMYYASEAKMLKWVLDRNYIKHDTIYNLTENFVYRVKPTDVRAGNKPLFRGRSLLDDLKPTFTAAKGVDSSPAPLPQQQTAKERTPGKTKSTTTGKSFYGKDLSVPIFGTPKAEEKGRHTVKPVSDFHRKCLSCEKSLTLYDQRRATTVASFGRTAYVCDSCLTPDDPKQKESWISANIPLLQYVN